MISKIRKTELNIWCLELELRGFLWLLTRWAHTEAGVLISRFWDCRWATDFQLTPEIFHWLQVWRQAQPFQDLARASSGGSSSCWKTCSYCSHWWKEVVGQDLGIHSSIHPPLNRVWSSCTLCRRASPKKYSIVIEYLHHAIKSKFII